MSTVGKLVRKARDAANDGDVAQALSALESAFVLAAREGQPEQVASIVRRIGTLYHQQGDLEAGKDCFEAALAIATQWELQQERATAMVSIAAMEQHLGRLSEAEELYREALAIAEEIEDRSLAAKIELNLGVIANVRGEYELAVRRYRTALKRLRNSGEEAYALGAMNNLGMAYCQLGRWNTAAKLYDEAEELATRLDDRRMLGNVATNRAQLLLQQDQLQAAREQCEASLKIFNGIGWAPGIAEAHKLHAIYYRRTDRPELAEHHFQLATDLSRECGDRLLEAETLSEWSILHQYQDRNREALQQLNGSYRIFTELTATRELLALERRLDGLEINYLEIVRAWAESIESKDEYTAGHCERVANYACMLAERLGIEGRDLTWMRMGGFLHDVGKIVVPAEILNKPGKLTAEEWAIMQSHAAEGDAIVAELNFPWDIGPIVRSHHERWDGSGYPDGIAGEEIPLTARILCIADVYDALTTTRSYRGAMPREKALDIMTADSGRIFDPSLYPIFADLIRNQVPQLDQRFPAFPSPAAVAAA